MSTTTAETNNNENTIATTATEAQEVQDSPRSTKSVIQHPLEHTWALWFHNPSQKTNAANFFMNLNQVYAVSTIEQFWGLYNHVMTPSKLGMGCTYYLFRQGVQPKWEDENCVGGGEWLLPLDTKGIKPDQAKQLMDQYWLNAMLACISGDAFGEYEEYICGVAAMIRKQPRISLWIRKTPDDKTILAIGEIFRNVVLLLDADLSDEEKRQASMFKVQFKSFADQMKFIRDPRFQIPK